MTRCYDNSHEKYLGFLFLKCQSACFQVRLPNVTFSWRALDKVHISHAKIFIFLANPMSRPLLKIVNCENTILTRGQNIGLSGEK